MDRDKQRETRLLRRPKSPELIARMEASAEKYRELTNKLGRAFATAQEEAHDNWAQAMEEMKKNQKE